MTGLPGFVWAIVGIGVVGLPAVTLVVLAGGARAAGLNRRTSAAVVAMAGVAWAGWLAGSITLAQAGVYRFDRAIPWIAIVMLAVLAAVLLATRIPVVARILADAGTPARLAAPQTVRVLGVVFLIVAALGELPAIFALPAGLGDIAVGVAAPFVAWRLSRHGSRGDHRRAVRFNVLGLVDLIVAVGIGVLAAPGPVTLLPVAPSTEALATLPLVLIPTTVVPLAVALHVISLRRLGAARRAAVRTTRPAVHAAG